MFSPTLISHKLFLNRVPSFYYFYDLERLVGAKAPIVGSHVVELALDKRGGDGRSHVDKYMYKDAFSECIVYSILAATIDTRG